MGFLRKVGRKIKKGIKKLFSSKIGAFVGSIALSMIMGPVISRAFNGIKGAFAGTGATAGQAAAQATTQAATEAAKQATASLATDAGTKLTTEQILSGETLQSVASKKVTGKALTEEGIKTAFTNSTAASRKAMQSAIQAGNPIDFTNVLTQGTASGTIPLNISDTVTGSLNNTLNYIETGDMFTPKISKAIEANKQIMEAPKLFGDKKLGADIKENFKGVKEFTKDPIGKTKSYLGDSFVPDAVESIAMSEVKSALTPEYEEPFQSQGVQDVGSDIQSSYMKEVQTQVPNLQTTNFQQLNQSLLYGTLSPQYLMGQAQYS